MNRWLLPSDFSVLCLNLMRICWFFENFHQTDQSGKIVCPKLPQQVLLNMLFFVIFILDWYQSLWTNIGPSVVPLLGNNENWPGVIFCPIWLWTVWVNIAINCSISETLQTDMLTWLGLVPGQWCVAHSHINHHTASLVASAKASTNTLIMVGIIYWYCTMQLSGSVKIQPQERPCRSPVLWSALLNWHLWETK